MTGASRIAFRVDAGAQIGAGHVIRCLSLAAALRGCGGESHFICRDHDGHLATLIESQGHRVRLLPQTAARARDSLGAHSDVDADETLQELTALQPDWLVADHYALDARWEQRIRSATQRVLVIDDLADRPHDADILVDPNIQARPGRYEGLVPHQCRVLLGPRFALLRGEFARLRNQAPRVRDGRLRHVLGCAGGSDGSDFLPKIIAAWDQLPENDRPQLSLAVGSHSANVERLRKLCAERSHCELHVQTDRMAELIAAADLMITSGGGINWERCCLGVPGLVCATADNQADNVRELARARSAISLGRAQTLDISRLAPWLRRLAGRPALLARIGARAARLVDGAGARRVACSMTAHRVTLRPGTPSDAESAWHWRNAEATRRHSTDSRTIALADHLDWWERTLVDPQRMILVAQIGDTGIGILRLDRQESSATVSIYLDPALTGLGLGTRVLRAARAIVADSWPQIRELVADIRAENRASARAFASAGFRAANARWSLTIAAQP